MTPSEAYNGEVLHQHRGLPWAIKGNEEQEPLALDLGLPQRMQGRTIRFADEEGKDLQEEQGQDKADSSKAEHQREGQTREIDPKDVPLPQGDTPPTTPTRSSSTTPIRSALASSSRTLMKRREMETDEEPVNKNVKMKITYSQGSTVKRRGEGAEEQAHKSLRLDMINSIGSVTHREVAVNEEPDTITWNYENIPAEELQKAMDAEMESMNNFKVFTPVKKDEVPHQAQIIATRWVHRMKPTDQGLKAKSRLVAKRFAQPVEDKDEVYACMPLLTAVRTLRISA